MDTKEPAAAKDAELGVGASEPSGASEETMQPEQQKETGAPVETGVPVETGAPEEEPVEGFVDKIENAVEILLFGSRWLLAPVYLGLVVAMVVAVIKFLQQLVGFVIRIPELNTETMAIGVLQLIDVALLANLLLIVIFSGYENFVSKINPAQDHEDRPEWMGHLDFSGLKIKIVGSIVAISLIELLQDFMHAIDGVQEGEIWRIALHLVFVVSGTLFAIMDFVAEKRETIETPERLEKHAKHKNRGY